jgi:hypothetical protein
MKNLYLCLMLALLAFNAKSQNCFGEYDNIVSSLVCVNAKGGFDIMSQTALIENPTQKKFAITNTNDKEYIPSFYMMESSGDFSNIHQYGFQCKGFEIYLTYKIVQRYTNAELAFVIANYPAFHKVVNIETEPKNGYHTITGNYRFQNKDYSFAIILDGSDLVAVSMGSIFISRIE